jgi:hypothetical protein
VACDNLEPNGCDESYSSKKRARRLRTPAMIGDFFGGSPLRLGADATLDSLFVFADDLDAPLILPPPGSVLLISEPGPVGVFSSSITSIQQLQTLLQNGDPLPGAVLVGTVNDDATLTTSLTIAEIQNQLAAAGLPYEIIAIAPPPGSYNAAVSSIFQNRNWLPGMTVYMSQLSGALIQGGVNDLSGGEDLDAYYFYEYRVRFDTLLADASSGGVGRLKIAEGGTVLPQNRVFMRYNYFHNVAYSNPGVALNRFTPGFERAFMDGLFSVELRAPFASDARVNSTFDGDSFQAGGVTRFGNLTTYLKTLLLDRDDLAISGGLGISTPTASDLRVNLDDGTELLRVGNNAAHLQPFLGMLYTPSERLFAHGFLQFDFAGSGNRVAINDGNGLANVGSITDPNHLFLNFGVGGWLVRNNGRKGLTGVIPTLELHHTNSINRGETLSAGPFDVGNYAGAVSMTSAVAGTTFEFGQASQLTLGYATPLTGGVGQMYDGAFRLMYTRQLGR